MWKTLFVFAVLSLVIGGIAAANLRRDPSALDLDWNLIQEPPREVIAESPARGSIIQTVTAPGLVEAVEEAEIASQAIGRVIQVTVKDGDIVKQGDLLVKLDDTDVKARIDSAAARIDRLRSAILQSEKDFEKAVRDEAQAEKLANRGFSTPTELADARTLLAKAQAGLKMSRNDLIESEAMRRTSLEELVRTEIRAPINGVVSGLSVDVGEVVIAGMTNLPGSVLMTISNMSKLRVRADVDETDVSLVRREQPARVFLQADQRRPVPARVDRVASKGKKKEEVVSFESLIDVNDSDSILRPGMSATVEIEVKRSDQALSVPVQSVVHRRRKDLPDSPEVRAWIERNAYSPGEKAQEAEARYVKIVFVVQGERVRARPVETGISDERRIEILSGVKPDERVVVAPFRALDELKDGSGIKQVQSLSASGLGG